MRVTKKAAPPLRQKPLVQHVHHAYRLQRTFHNRLHNAGSTSVSIRMRQK